MFHRNLFKDPNNYYLQETQETVSKIEKFLSGESEDRPNIFRVNRVFLPSGMFHYIVFSGSFYFRKRRPFFIWIFGENKPRKSNSIGLTIWKVTEKVSINQSSSLCVESQSTENIKTRNWRPLQHCSFNYFWRTASFLRKLFLNFYKCKLGMFKL